MGYEEGRDCGPSVFLALTLNLTKLDVGDVGLAAASE